MRCMIPRDYADMSLRVTDSRNVGSSPLIARAIVDRRINVGSASFAFGAAAGARDTRCDHAKRSATYRARRSIDEDCRHRNRDSTERYSHDLGSAHLGSHKERIKNHRKVNVQRERDFRRSRLHGLSNRLDSIENRLSLRAVRRFVQVHAAMRAGICAWIGRLSTHCATGDTRKIAATSRALRSPQILCDRDKNQQYCNCHRDIRCGSGPLGECPPQRESKDHGEHRPERHFAGEPSSAFNVLPDRHGRPSYRFREPRF
jgi:hypothetical protein